MLDHHDDQVQLTVASGGHPALHSTIATASSMDAQRIADAIVAAALDFQDGQAQDDIAVVVLKVA